MKLPRTFKANVPCEEKRMEPWLPRGAKLKVMHPGALRWTERGCLPQRAGGARTRQESPATISSFLELKGPVSLQQETVLRMERAGQAPDASGCPIFRVKSSFCLIEIENDNHSKKANTGKCHHHTFKRAHVNLTSAKNLSAAK